MRVEHPPTSTAARSGGGGPLGFMCFLCGWLSVSRGLGSERIRRFLGGLRLTWIQVRVFRRGAASGTTGYPARSSFWDCPPRSTGRCCPKQRHREKSFAACRASGWSSCDAHRFGHGLALRFGTDDGWFLEHEHKAPLEQRVRRFPLDHSIQIRVRAIPFHHTGADAAKLKLTRYSNCLSGAEVVAPETGKRDPFTTI